MPKKKKKKQQTAVAPPSATGGAGPWFEGKVGAFYLLSLLASSEPRGLPGATATSVQFQQAAADRPLDDFTIEALNADGSQAYLEIQAKRSLDFTKSDVEFEDVVLRMWRAAQKPEFAADRYELAVAISRTTTRIERSCQEVLHWARQLPDGEAFAKHIARKNFASDEMRNFVDVFRNNLKKAGAPTDPETVWKLLCRFQILVFDFEAPGSDYEHRARERARIALVPEQTSRAPELWPILAARAMDLARAGGAIKQAELAAELSKTHELRFSGRTDLRQVLRKLAEYSTDVLNDIRDQIGGVRLSRMELVEQGLVLLESNRMLQIIAAPGVGKSAVLKQLALRLEPGGRILVTAPSRIVPGGWVNFANVVGCAVTRDELFNELGCSGTTTLFIDNIDQVDNDEDWATLRDLLRGAAANPGWRVVVTAGREADWRRKIPEELRGPQAAALELTELTDAETAVLSDEGPALSALLHKDHPARAIARNLFNLSRLLDLNEGSAAAAEKFASETDLARAWWGLGGGRDPTGRLARLKALRAIGGKMLAEPGRGVVRVDELDSEIVGELVRLDSLREIRAGATVAFRHDVLRDWTIGFLLDEEPERIKELSLSKPLPGALARAIEFAARLAIEADPSGARWLALLEALEEEACDGSWRRPVLLALPRSERALELLQRLEGPLLQNKGRRLRDLIKLMMAVESEPLSKFVARVMPTLPVPAGADAMVMPKGQSWAWLVVWALSRSDAMPDSVIPDLVKMFQSWLIATQAHGGEVNTLILELMFKWLSRLDDAAAPRTFGTLEEAKKHAVDIPHIRDVRDDIGMTCFSFAHLNRTAAEAYVSALDPKEIRHHDLESILRAPGTLSKAAPRAFVSFVLATLIKSEEEEEDSFDGRRRDVLGAFGVHEHIYSPASPGQGPFLDLLENAPAEGLRLIRGLVEHATEWRRSAYEEAGETFPSMTIHFPDGPLVFEGDFEVYHWARGNGLSAIVGSALMALEAWGHHQIEGGRSFDEVTRDVLGSSGSSAAFVGVAADLALSHWNASRETVWPLLATPELLQYDDHRYNRDAAGVDRFLPLEREPSNMRVKRADLDARVSRRSRLSDCIGEFALHGPAKTLANMQDRLAKAVERIGKACTNDDHPVHGLGAIAARALRMTDAKHWELKKARLPDGSEIEGHQFVLDPDEESRLKAEQARAAESIKHFNTRLQIQAALFDRAKSTEEIVVQGMHWAKQQLADKLRDAPDADDFDRQWDERAVVMAASLTMRDWAGPDRKDVIAWAIPLLDNAIAGGDSRYLGNDQVQYSEAAIAALGYIALHTTDPTSATQRKLLELAAHNHPAVQNSIGAAFEELHRLDARLARALVRITMASAVVPRREFAEDEDRKSKKASEDRIAAAIAAEHQWLAEDGTEPDWPDLPPWVTYPRRSFRIGGRGEAKEKAKEASPPELRVDERRMGRLTGHLVPLTLGEYPHWIVDLSGHLMRWTAGANGPHGDDGHDRDHRPIEWNGHYFDFVGILGVALSHEQLEKLFLEPMSSFTEEAFLDAAATFLRGFDRATLATNTRKPENPAAVREFFARRMRNTRNFQRLSSEKSMMAETHLGDALNAIFYQPARWGHRGKANLPDKWQGLPNTAPMLTELVEAAPPSGYIATTFLTMVESSPSMTLLPFVVAAMTAWCAAYRDDANFWVEKGIGTRICAWLEKTFKGEENALRQVAAVHEELSRCLDTLVRAGIAQASAVEKLIAEVPRQ